MSDESPPNKDDLLLSLLSKNDPAASTLLFGLYYETIYRSIKRMIKDSDDAKDLVLELFENVWERHSTLNIRKPIKSYLLAAARNRSINYLRDRQKSVEFFRDMVGRSPQSAIDSPDTDMELEELKRILDDATAMLPDRVRKTFILSRRFKMANKEIAARMSVSVKTVEGYMTIALKLLRKYIEQSRE